MQIIFINLNIKFANYSLKSSVSSLVKGAKSNHPITEPYIHFQPDTDHFFHAGENSNQQNHLGYKLPYQHL